MSDCVDDRTPLLQQPFQRGSFIRSAIRWPRSDHGLCLPSSLHHGSDTKPPLPPPRLSEVKRPQLTRSFSATERKESDACLSQSHVGRQSLRGSISPMSERRYIVTPPQHTRYLHSGTSEYGASLQDKELTHAEGSTRRNIFATSSLSRLKKTPPPSPDLKWKENYTSPKSSLTRSFSGRAADTHADDRSSTRKEKIYIPFISRFTRRSQTPPPPSSSHSVTYKRESTAPPHSPSSFRRHNSVPLKKSECGTNSLVSDTSSSNTWDSRPERRWSFRPPSSTLSRPSTSTSHYSDKYPLTHSDSSRYCTHDYRYSDRWRVETSSGNTKNLPDLHSERQRSVPLERHNSLRLSLHRRPGTTYLSSDTDPTHSHSSSSYLGDSTTTTTTTTTSPSPASPTLYYHRPRRSLDIHDTSPSNRSWEKNQIGACSESINGSQHKGVASPNLNLSRISSDSGYSTCSNTSGVSRTNSVISDCDGDMIVWFGSRLNLKEEESLAAKSPTDHFSYLMEKEKEYMVCLESMLSDYKDMISKTPSLIRQHFDLIFKQVEMIHAFQVELQDTLWQTHGQLSRLARVFTNEQFQCYGRYMVMMPAVQRDLMHYTSHFKEHFPDLKRNILKPSLRINFYAMMLSTFKKEATEDVKDKLQDAIDYLNQVKRKANTEMTLNTVIHSPVDLRLGGDMLYIGEVTYTGGGSLQKKKYQVILFENLLVITSMKIPYFKYKTHYRVEQLESVMPAGDNELLLNVLSEGQTQLTTLKFKIKTQRIRDEWVTELEKITRRNTKLSKGRGSININQIPRQRFRTLPLDLFSVFPLLKDVITDAITDKGKPKPHSEYSLSNMIVYEEKYVNDLSHVLNPENQKPPEPLDDLLESLHRLHSKRFLPALQRSETIGDFVDFLADNLEELSVYSDYLVIRSQLTLKLDNAPQAGPLIRPVQHVFGNYLGLLKELSAFEEYKKSSQRVIKSLREDVRVAQLRVLKEAIVNGRLDFQRSGNLIMYNRMELKTRKKEIRAGEYIVLLFENVIILTKPKQPYYEYVMDIWLDQVNLGPPSSHDCTFRVEVRQGGRKDPITYELCASSVEVKQEWHRCLHHQMLVQVEKIRERVAAVGEAAAGAAAGGGGR